MILVSRFFVMLTIGRILQQYQGMFPIVSMTKNFNLFPNSK